MAYMLDVDVSAWAVKMENWLRAALIANKVIEAEIEELKLNSVERCKISVQLLYQANNSLHVMRSNKPNIRNSFIRCRQSTCVPVRINRMTCAPPSGGGQQLQLVYRPGSFSAMYASAPP
ncbi:hypothetical protein TRIATDRAFT_297770, partial [Trichoderma atroviride IMI 206040]